MSYFVHKGYDPDKRIIQIISDSRITIDMKSKEYVHSL